MDNENNTLKKFPATKRQKQITKRKREESSPKPVNASDPVFDKGPGSIGKNKKVDKLFSQEERVEIVRSQ